jgi:hypothetical protein
VVIGAVVLITFGWIWWSESPLRKAQKYLEQGDATRALAWTDYYLASHPGEARGLSIKAQALDGAPDALDNGFGGEMCVQRRSPGRSPFFGCEEVLQFGAFRSPNPCRLAVWVLVKDRLDESAPARIANEALFFLRRRLARVLFERFEDADRFDIGANLLLRRTLADRIGGRNGIIAPRSLTDRSRRRG